MRKDNTSFFRTQVIHLNMNDNNLKIKKNRLKILVMAILLAVSCLLTYYFHMVLKVGTIFTHFFYIPIILAALWWKRKGLVVAIFLSVFLLLSNFFFREHLSTDDFPRAVMFFIVGFIVAKLSETISMERELRESNEFLSSLIESSYDGIIAADMKGNIIIFNKGAEKLLGYKAEETIGKINAVDLYPPGTAKEIMRRLRDKEFGGKGKLLSQRFIGISKSGEHIPVILSGAMIYHNGNEVATVGIFYDLRELMKAQKELLETDDKFHTLFETVRQGIFFSSREGRFLDCNQTIMDMLGYQDKKEFLSLDISLELYVDPADRLKFQEIVERDGYVKDYEVNFKRKDGQPITVLLTAHVNRDRSGIWYQVLVIDMTEMRRREEQMLQSAKMASLGKLAAGVAHEINNPLGGIFVYANLLLEKIPKGDPMRSNIEKILQSATRCKDTVRGLLNFSRPSKTNFLPTDVNTVIQNVIELIDQQGLFHNIEITKKFDDSIPPVIADKSQLEQVFMNILLNASEAMDGSGKIKLTTSSILQGPKSIEITISDSGPGIPEKNLNSVFEPFFTTKDPSSKVSGMGLGLAITYSIIEKHKGTLQVKSKLGKGTTFIIRLPIGEG